MKTLKNNLKNIYNSMGKINNNQSLIVIIHFYNMMKIIK